LSRGDCSCCCNALVLRPSTEAALLSTACQGFCEDCPDALPLVWVPPVWPVWPDAPGVRSAMLVAICCSRALLGALALDPCWFCCRAPVIALSSDCWETP